MTTPPKTVKPTPLHSGATLAVLSPASTPKSDLVQRGITRLQNLGYRTVLGKHALDRGPLYYAGTLEQRLEDLHAAFADPSIDGIVCTRGGWGSAELLPHLDAALIRA
ncbi:MAG TPA: LD-carboxypeptidase, partial [Edaphobacter sp.]|nr:LD-carboxypeptidase [Edaphobacter sp.]